MTALDVPTVNSSSSASVRTNVSVTACERSESNEVKRDAVEGIISVECTAEDGRVVDFMYKEDN